MCCDWLQHKGVVMRWRGTGMEWTTNSQSYQENRTEHCQPPIPNMDLKRVRTSSNPVGLMFSMYFIWLRRLPSCDKVVYSSWPETRQTDKYISMYFCGMQKCHCHKMSSHDQSWTQGAQLRKVRVVVLCRQTPIQFVNLMEIVITNDFVSVFSSRQN